MGRKKHAEEHENLERWLVSYADFITLLFATFVVLYALSQVDIAEFKELETSIRKAFAAPSLLQGSDGMMKQSGDSILGSEGGADSSVPPILEYLGTKYEEKSFEEIKNSIDKMSKDGDLSGVSAKIDDRGLVISLDEMILFFGSGNSNLSADSHNALKSVGSLINKKFNNRFIRIEGHTDNLAVKSDKYPSNWELSSARASTVVRFLIDKFNFDKNRFTAVGYADTRPISSNASKYGRSKNRRVEIVILKKTLARAEAGEMMAVHNKKKKQPSITNNISDAAMKLVNQKGYKKDSVLVLKDSYDQESAELQKELAEIEKNKKVKFNIDVINLSDQRGHSHVSEATRQLYIDIMKEKEEYKKQQKELIQEKLNRKKEEHKKQQINYDKLIKENTDENIIKQIFDNLGFNSMD